MQQIHAPSKQHASLSQDSDRSLSIAKGVSSSSIASGVKERVLLTIDPTCPKPKKTRKVEWELNIMFQNVWVANYLGLRVGKMFMFKCKVCTCVERRKKLQVFPQV
jgi:hypothetical protein